MHILTHYIVLYKIYIPLRKRKKREKEREIVEVIHVLWPLAVS